MEAPTPTQFKDLIDQYVAKRNTENGSNYAIRSIEGLTATLDCDTTEDGLHTEEISFNTSTDLFKVTKTIKKSYRVCNLLFY